MGQNQLIYLSLHLSYEQYLRVYQGAVKNISVTADDGRKIVFPARNIQSFLTKEGITGYFEMELTDNNKFIRITKLN